MLARVVKQRSLLRQSAVDKMICEEWNDINLRAFPEVAALLGGLLAGGGESKLGSEGDATLAAVWIWS